MFTLQLLIWFRFSSSIFHKLLSAPKLRLIHEHGLVVISSVLFSNSPCFMVKCNLSGSCLSCLDLFRSRARHGWTLHQPLHHKRDTSFGATDLFRLMTTSNSHTNCSNLWLQPLDVICLPLSLVYLITKLSQEEFHYLSFSRDLTKPLYFSKQQTCWTVDSGLAGVHVAGQVLKKVASNLIWPWDYSFVWWWWLITGGGTVV